MAGKIYVGCKMPNGLHLDIITTEYTTQNGVKEVLSQERERIATLAGTAFKADPEGMTPNPTIGNFGYAITEVDGEAFMKWAELNKSAPVVKSHLVIWAEKREALISQARELQAQPGQFARLRQADIDKMGYVADKDAKAA